MFLDVMQNLELEGPNKLTHTEADDKDSHVWDNAQETQNQIQNNVQVPGIFNSSQSAIKTKRLIPMYDSLEEFEQHLPDTVTVLDTPFGSKVYLVGTAHFSEESQDDVSLVFQ